MNFMERCSGGAVSTEAMLVVGLRQMLSDGGQQQPLEDLDGWRKQRDGSVAFGFVNRLASLEKRDNSDALPNGGDARGFDALVEHVR